MFTIEESQTLSEFLDHYFDNDIYERLQNIPDVDTALYLQELVSAITTIKEDLDKNINSTCKIIQFPTKTS